MSPATYSKVSAVDTCDISPDVRGRLLERCWRIQVKFFESEEVKHASYVGKDVLSQSLVEGERLQAS